MHTKKVNMISLGCAKNSVLSEHVKALFPDKNYAFTEFADEADIIIVNTCGFINDAKEESIQTILDASVWTKDDPDKRLVVIGCMVQKYGEELKASIPEVDLFVGATHYHEIKDLVEKSYHTEENDITLINDENWRGMSFADNAERVVEKASFAYLLISEGCDHRCSYCAIPDMQGPYRSRSLQALVQEAEKLVAEGYRELILIGQDTTYYGMDLYGEPSLYRLLEALSDIEELKWIRILYAYPNDLDERTIKAMASLPKVCRYLDMPLQHASNAVLKRMNRKITCEEIKEKIRLLRQYMPDISLRSTFITGFPGETEDDFQTLLRFLEEVKLDRVGVFPYSEEDGTPAANMKDQVEPSVREARAEELMTTQFDIMYAKHQKRIGQECELIVDEKSPDLENVWLCRSYAEAPEVDPFVLVKTTEDLQIGDFIKARIIDLESFDMWAEII